MRFWQGMKESKCNSIFTKQRQEDSNWTFAICFEKTLRSKTMLKEIEAEDDDGQEWSIKNQHVSFLWVCFQWEWNKFACWVCVRVMEGFLFLWNYFPTHSFRTLDTDTSGNLCGHVFPDKRVRRSFGPCASSWHLLNDWLDMWRISIGSTESMSMSITNFFCWRVKYWKKNWKLLQRRAESDT